jgi:hypothetical protein
MGASLGFGAYVRTAFAARFQSHDNLFPRRAALLFLRLSDWTSIAVDGTTDAFPIGLAIFVGAYSQKIGIKSQGRLISASAKNQMICVGCSPVSRWKNWTPRNA